MKKPSNKIFYWLENSSMKGGEPDVISSSISIHIWIPLLLPGEHLKYHCARYSRWKYLTPFLVVCDYAEINSGNCELKCLFIITWLSFAASSPWCIFTRIEIGNYLEQKLAFWLLVFTVPSTIVLWSLIEVHIKEKSELDNGPVK